MGEDGGTLPWCVYHARVTADRTSHLCYKCSDEVTHGGRRSFPVDMSQLSSKDYQPPSVIRPSDLFNRDAVMTITSDRDVMLILPPGTIVFEGDHSDVTFEHKFGLRLFKDTPVRVKSISDTREILTAHLETEDDEVLDSLAEHISSNCFDDHDRHHALGSHVPSDPGARNLKLHMALKSSAHSRGNIVSQFTSQGICMSARAVNHAANLTIKLEFFQQEAVVDLAEREDDTDDTEPAQDDLPDNEVRVDDSEDGDQEEEEEAQADSETDAPEDPDNDYTLE